MSKTLILSALVALSQARFQQEQVPVAAVQALDAFGNPGEAATLAGQVPGVLLGGANACDKLTLADQIVDTLGTDPAVIAAAQGLVAAEKNFNPFTSAIPTICSTAGLPKTPELQGILPLVDPDVLGSDVENANSADSLASPSDAGGQSVADLAIAAGFSNFTSQAADGSTADVAGADAGAAADDTADQAAVQCPGAAPADEADDSADAADDSADADAADEADAGAGANAAGVQQSSIAGLDFGLCVPTMDFQLGRENRKADEGTFLPTDELVAKGQQDALNPNIITNRICDQLTNVCEANQAAKDACDAAQTLVQGLGTKDATTADAFNKALGF